MVNGAFREPGEITILFMPFALQWKTTVCAEGMLEYFMNNKNTTEVVLNPILKRVYNLFWITFNIVALLFTVSSHSCSGIESMVIPPPM